jgi:putative membrane protein
VLIAHLAPPIAPDELWRAWSLDIVAWVGLLGALVLHTRGRRGLRRHRWRHRAFVAGVVALALALVSPLDALSSSLASAHMVQHLLLTLVAAPLLVASKPIPVFLRGLSPSRRRRVLALTRSDRPRDRGWSPHVVTLAVLHVVVLWLWHAGGLYDAALRNDLLHRLEHITFLATAVLSWAAILARGAAGLGLLVLFGLSVQSALLGALMTFAATPWYSSYAGRTAAWGLSPVADQQLAGVIMWVPGGGAFLVAALALLAVLVTDTPMRTPAELASGAGRGLAG